MDYGFKKLQERVKAGATQEQRALSLVQGTAEIIRTHKSDPVAIEAIAAEFAGQDGKALAGYVWNV